MQKNSLDAVLGQRSKLGALRCLFSERQELTGREISRRTGLSHLAVHKALKELEAEGVVAKRDAPPSYQFQLNRKHWLVADILAPMFEKERGWLEHLEREITHGAPEGVVSMILFGSAAKGELASRSDIDVLVLVDDDRRKEHVRAYLQRAGGKVYASFQHPLSSVVLSVREFLEQYRGGGEFAREISYSGRVICGELLTEVLFEHGGKKD